MKDKRIKLIIGYMIILYASYIIGAFIGDQIVEADLSDSNIIITFILAILALFIAMILQIIIHELGHLIFGLLTNYHFVSFRIGSLMFIKKEGKIRLCKYHLPGTLGQCLLSPPNYNDNNFPQFLYNMGGVILNLISASIFGSIVLVFDLSLITKLFMMLLALFGLINAIINGVPNTVGLVDNDGKNAMTLLKDKSAKRSFWNQLKINELLSKGIRLKDMDDDLFELSSDDLSKGINSAIMTFECSRLIDKHEFKLAKEKINQLLSYKDIMKLYQQTLTNDLAFLEYLDGNNDKANALIDKAQLKFMKASKYNPSVIRTKALHQKITLNDQSGITNGIKELNELANHYPYPTEIELELELLNLFTS